MAYLGDVSIGLTTSYVYNALEVHYPKGAGILVLANPSGGIANFAGHLKLDKQPTPLTIVVPASKVSLMQQGRLVEYAEGMGTSFFYDYDDGIYYAYEAGTGNAWKITVTGASYTIEALGSGGGGGEPGAAGTRVSAFIY